MDENPEVETDLEEGTDSTEEPTISGEDSPEETNPQEEISQKEEQQMATNLDRIVNVQIGLQSPIVDTTSFDNILIYGPQPASKKTADNNIYKFSSIEEAVEAGHIVTGNDADPVGLACMVAFSQSPSPDYVMVAYWHENDNVSERLAQLCADSRWYVICPVGLEAAVNTAISTYIETQERLCLLTNAAVTIDTSGLSAQSLYRTAIIDTEAANALDPNTYLAVAWAARNLSYHPGEATWAHKNMSVVEPTKLTSTQIDQLKAARHNYYIDFASRALTYDGKVLADEWIDVIRFRDWLKNDMQLRVVNLFVTNPKIPYTNQGIALIENQMIAALKAGQNYGGVANTEYDSNGTAIPGYVVQVPNAADLTADQRHSRVLTDCKFSARLAGAIHVVEIKGSLAYTLT